MGFLFSSQRDVRRYVREVTTRNELANLEAAFRQYYDHYGCWPVVEADDYDNDVEAVIDEDLIDILSGKPDIPLNPDQIPFFEIFRVNSDKEAVNAWGDTYGKPYRVKFDTNGDNTLDFNGEVLHRSVIVWTEHPEPPKNTPAILGSWQK